MRLAANPHPNGRWIAQWCRLLAGVTLADALRILETDDVLHPV
jgi:hypothetical protein